jgi:membrane-associated protease RseP (regulator of RpoE activity)
MEPEMDAATTTCGNCRSPMPRELRFCRNCGFRLGEGSAEYTETVRFQDVPPGALPDSAANFPHGFAGGPMSVAPGGQIRKRRRRMSGMTWIFICLLIFFIAGGVFSSMIKFSRGVHVQFAQSAPRSYAGVDDFSTTDGGVTFGEVWPAGSPADKAGLVGGDIITTVDGQAVHSDDEMTDQLRRIPIGGTVDIVYLRDGETKNTKLTTISKAELDQLGTDFAARPEGRGRFGYNNNDSERVEIAGTKMFGVRLDSIESSRPADMAGIKEGDIVIEFDKIPIRTPEELTARVRRAIPYETVDVVVMRGGERLTIPVKMGRQD